MAGVYGTSVIPKPALLAITLLGLTGSPAFARSYHLRDIEVVDPWSRPAPAGATAVGYMVLTNHGKRPVSLLSANTTAAKAISLHQTTVAAGVATMATLPKGIVIPSGGSVSLSPGGYHMMLEKTVGPLSPDGSVPVTLVFSGGKNLRIDLEVRTGTGVASPADAMAGMSRMKH
jgi:copper(I)-binding protein